MVICRVRSGFTGKCCGRVGVINGLILNPHLTYSLLKLMEIIPSFTKINE